MDQPRLFVALKTLIGRDGKIMLLREAGPYADGTHIGKRGCPADA